MTLYTLYIKLLLDLKTNYAYIKFNYNKLSIHIMKIINLINKL